MFPLCIVVLALLAAAAPASASFVLTPAAGPADTDVRVVATQLPAHAVVQVRAARTRPQFLVADAAGRVEATVRIPAGARDGVPVDLIADAGHTAEVWYRVGSAWAATRAVETADWEGRRMRLGASLDHGRLRVQTDLWGVRPGATVGIRNGGGRVGRAVAGRRGRARATVRLPAAAAETLLHARVDGDRLSGRLPTPPAVLAAVGDIACRRDGRITQTRCRHADTAQLAAQFTPDAAALLGDIQYQAGSLAEFRGSFDRSWGRLRTPLLPTPGNHEYRTPGAAGYFDYFAERLGSRPASWYARDLGHWRVISLNSNCELVACEAGSEQERWLRAELAANPRRCTIAFWHHPRFSSGFHGSDHRTAPFWQALHEANAEAVLAGHDHDYERFARQNAFGVADATGPRAFVVGTGGKDFTPLREPRAPQSAYGRDDVHGVLILRLYERHYSWRYVALGGRVLDYGNDSCR